LFISIKGNSQNADPGIGIIMSPPTVPQGSTGILSANVGNYGNSTIVENSLIVTITVGVNAEILGVAAGSDSRWVVFSMTTGSANTIKLTNASGSFTPFDVGDILLTIQGNVVSLPNIILGNIAFIPGVNPLLCSTCLSSSQGNALNSNDDSQTSIEVSLGNGDLDGDGDPDATDPNPTNPCVYGAGQVLANASATWNASDCDLDGNPNGSDPHVLVPVAVNDTVTAPYGQASTVNILANDDFLANDGNTITQAAGGTAGGTVTFNPVTGIMSYTPLASESGTTVTVIYQVCQGSVCATATVTITVPSGDLDGDGDPDATDPNPTNPCVYGAGQVLANASATWNASDCDLDGNPNGTDPHVLVPVAVNDTVTAPYGQESTVNILANDDFLANDGNTITQAAGGTAGGTVTFNPVTGIMSYTPLASESGTTVTINYQVCQGSVCATATVTITVNGCYIEVFNAVTPNNDGNNDYFYIKGLECFTDNSVEIFNRWGIKVFEIENYDNNLRVFKGYSEGRVTINQSDALPNGTYYYILNYKGIDGNVTTKTGFLYLTQ
jgi:gliding motility-associated-like protein